MQTLVVAWLLSFIVVMAIIRSNHWHVHLSSDVIDGVQKFHRGAIPRIGGLGIIAGLGGALGWSAWRGLIGVEMAWLLIAALPAFGAGLAEDVTKRVGVAARLLATMAAAAVGAWGLGAVLPRLGVPGVDALLALWPLLAWAVTLVAVAGVANAVNIIDGFNGLAAATSMLMFMAFGYVAWVLGDSFIVQVCLAMIGALAGFFVWNYPRGLIFLGDGGAYLVGFLLAEVAVLLVVRHPQLSPWFCLLVCAYPITETLFSIYRKRFLRGMSPGVPDGLHLHMLVYRRLVRWAAGHEAARDVTARNSATSPYLWGLASLGIVPAVLFWHDERWLVASALGFVVAYVWVYARLVRFRVPGWLRRRVGDKT
ncbi:glycosyl transferase [Tepidimonas fonticaldi]|uniref:Glycosyl transferase n=1 Tax=Tepidimonas fonticaldi TaxID=1101373 RepID=A0A1A6DY66_9BURK|nr:glycosyltransferase [Tepidimonas fonticaldi]OBS31902.1 glycosyl transferase [Tepidimonas fonticaldi]